MFESSSPHAASVSGPDFYRQGAMCRIVSRQRASCAILGSMHSVHRCRPQPQRCHIKALQILWPSSTVHASAKDVQLSSSNSSTEQPMATDNE